jgi:hypothetical protein
LILYTEEQLGKAYRVYLYKIPAGQLMLDLEEFREMIEEAGIEIFEGFIEDYERLKLTTH